MGRFTNALKKLMSEPEYTLYPVTIQVAGACYYEKEFAQYLGTLGMPKNPNYLIKDPELFHGREYEYPYIPALHLKLVPEPKNPHDRNAIYISVSCDSLTKNKVGYVSASQNEELLKLIKERKIYALCGYFKGGNSIIHGEGNSVVECKDDYKLVVTAVVKKYEEK